MGSARASGMAEQAYAALRSGLLKGEFQPSQHLVELDLVAQLGVNRAAVREALAKLEAEALIERRANRGAVVRRISAQEVRDVLQMRIALESLAVAWACERRSDLQVEQLQSAMAELEDRAERHDVDEFAAAQAGIHDLLMEMAGSPLLATFVKSLSGQTAMIRRHSLSIPGRLEDSLAEHRGIADAVIAGDAESAAEAMQRHLRRVWAAIVST